MQRRPAYEIFTPHGRSEVLLRVLMGNCLMVILAKAKYSENSRSIETINSNGDNLKQEDKDANCLISSLRTSPYGTLTEFTLEELRKASSGFSLLNLLGEGGFGTVYKGQINGFLVAIKKLNAEGCQGHKEWLTEVESLGKLHHQNIVHLIGLCFEGDQRLLVYEYMPMGSLEDLLADDCAELSWERRIRIIIGIAEGISFLHNQQPPIIHRDLKPSNILIDSNYNAKLCDFGLARVGPTAANSHVSTRVMGTCAYVDPEYYQTGQLRLGSDIYGFGILLLRILTGRKALERDRKGRLRTIADWARPFLLNKEDYMIQEIMDPRLIEYPAQSAIRLASLANCCTMGCRMRPKADQIVRILSRIDRKYKLAVPPAEKHVGMEVEKLKVIIN